MNMATDPTFVAAEVAYRFERDHVTTVARPRTGRHHLPGLWHRVTHLHHRHGGARASTVDQ